MRFAGNAKSKSRHAYSRKSAVLAMVSLILVGSLVFYLARYTLGSVSITSTITSTETTTATSTEITTVTSVQATTTTTILTETSTATQIPENLPCTFYVFTNGTSYYAQNCETGAISYGGPNDAGGAPGGNAALVIGGAINSTAANNGGLVALGTGRYNISGSIDLYEGVWLDGLNQGWSESGNGAVIQTAGNYSAIIFKSYSIGGNLLFLGRLSNVLLLGSSSILDTNNFGIRSTDNSTHDFYVDHVAINDFYAGIYATEPKLRVSDSTIEGNMKYGLYLWGPVADLYDLYIRENGLGNAGFGAYFRGATIQLEDSQIWLNNGGVVLYDDSPCLNCSDYIISGNWFNSNAGINGTGANLYLVGFPGYPMNAVITGNVFAAASDTNVPAYDISVTTSLGGVITGNDIEVDSYATAAVEYGPGSTTLLSSNTGFNPVNMIANAWALTTVGLGGTDAAPGKSGGTYTLTGVSASFVCSGGGIVSITVKDGAGDAMGPTYTCSTLPTTFLPPGYSLTITNSSDFASFSVYGD